MPKEPITPPETQYEVHIDEFMKALRGEPFTERQGLYRVPGSYIKKIKLLGNTWAFLEDNQDYVVLSQSRLMGAMVLENKERVDYGVGLVLYKSIVQGIVLEQAIIAGLYFANSQSGDISIEENSQSGDIHIGANSQSGDISIWNNSQSGDIGIEENSQSGDIRIGDKSQSGNISIWNNSQSGYIRVEDNSRLGYIHVEDNSRSGYIRINSSSQSGYIRIEGNSRSGYIGIWDNSQSDDIHVGGSSRSGDIRIEGSSQSGDISIKHGSQSGDINIKYDSRSSSIDISYNSQSGNIGISYNSQSGSISIGDNSQSSDIRIWHNSQLDNIRIWHSSQSDDIHIGNNSKPLAITIASNSQTGNLDFQNAQLSHVAIADNYFGLRLYNTQFLMIRITQCLLSRLHWGVGTKGELYVSEQTNLLYLQLTHTSLLKDSLLSLSDTHIHYAILQELQVQGYFLMRQVSAPTQYPFAWRDIDAYIGEMPQDNLAKQRWQSKKKLLEVQKKRYEKELEKFQQAYGNTPVFRISHSSLGKTEITGSNLAGYRFEYLNSKLLDCFITGTELPKNKIDIYNPNPNTKINDKGWHEQKVSIYNQFKKIYENQGDVVEASWYHAKAMDNQQALLQLVYKEQAIPWYKKIVSEKAFNLLGFRLNKASNNHGESWRVALRFILIISAIMYGLYYLFIHWHEPFGFAKTGRFFGDYFGFLDITHRIDFHVPKEQLTFWPKLFDFFGRILIGYGFFQFIAAFRRHGKKGS